MSKELYQGALTTHNPNYIIGADECIISKRKQRSNIIDLTGQVFNSWTVIKRQNSKWLCSCKCGYEALQRGNILKSGKSKACKNCSTKKNQHGHAGRNSRTYSLTYSTWQSIIQRYRTRENYKKLGLYEPWLTYVNFLTDVGERPNKEYSLDRIDNTKGYFPGNVRWATKEEQARNKNNNKFLEFKGEIKCLQEWANDFGIHAATVQGRLHRGWSVEKTLTTPTFTNIPVLIKPSLTEINEYIKVNNIKYILGIDEVATGACAGPILVCGVLLAADKILDVKDSKKYLKNALIKTADKLIAQKINYHIVSLAPNDIDNFGQGYVLQNAFKEITTQLYIDSCLVILDGTRLINGFQGVQVALPKADDLVPAVSAASIIAKRFQLIWSALAHKQNPNYVFDKHHGYGTKEHKDIIEKYGILEEHRKSVACIQEYLLKYGKYKNE